MEERNVTYTESQINAVLQILNSLQITGIDNCVRLAEVVRLLQPSNDNSVPVSEKQKTSKEK